MHTKVDSHSTHTQHFKAMQIIIIFLHLNQSDPNTTSSLDWTTSHTKLFPAWWQQTNQLRWQLASFLFKYLQLKIFVAANCGLLILQPQHIVGGIQQMHGIRNAVSYGSFNTVSNLYFFHFVANYNFYYIHRKWHWMADVPLSNYSLAHCSALIALNKKLTAWSAEDDRNLSGHSNPDQNCQ